MQKNLIEGRRWSGDANLTSGNKLATTYDAAECAVIAKADTGVTVQNQQTGRTYQRSSTHLKKILDRKEQLQTSKNSSLQDFQEDHDVSEMVSRSDQPTTFEEPMNLELDKEQPEPSERPKRLSRRPTKFDDYVVDDESSYP